MFVVIGEIGVGGEEGGVIGVAGVGDDLTVKDVARPCFLAGCSSHVVERNVPFIACRAGLVIFLMSPCARRTATFVSRYASIERSYDDCRSSQTAPACPLASFSA